MVGLWDIAWVTLIFWYLQEQVTNIKLEFVTTILIVFARKAGLINLRKTFVISRPTIGSSEFIWPYSTSCFIPLGSRPRSCWRCVKRLRSKWQTYISNMTWGLACIYKESQTSGHSYSYTLGNEEGRVLCQACISHIAWMILGSFRLDHEYEFEYEYHIQISNHWPLQGSSSSCWF